MRAGKLLLMALGAAATLPRALVPVLVEAVKSRQARIKALQRRNARMEARRKALVRAARRPRQTSM